MSSNNQSTLGQFLHLLGQQLTNFEQIEINCETNAKRDNKLGTKDKQMLI